MRVIDLRGRQLTQAQLRQELPRAEVNISVALERVAPILERVRTAGAEALNHYAQTFDGVVPPTVRVPAEVLHRSLTELDPQVRAALEESIRRARIGHEAQLPTEKVSRLAAGATVTQRWIPVARVGLYVPGGLAVLPSSVVMNVVAAQVAGVPELAVATPPQKANGGYPDPTILAACALLGIEEVYAVGGGQAIAMFAYGVETLAGDGSVDTANSCTPVDVVTGPGNIYVAAAKRAVRGLVGIDSEAGTTEIAVLADAGANPAFVAADLISQAEHDPAAASVLVTDSPRLLEQVQTEVTRQAAEATHAERIHEALSGPQSAMILTDTLGEAIAVVNAYAAEHLEIQTENSAEVATRITNAGAIFVGPYSPVPLGDYIAGSNHVLPTGGTARFASGLGVQAYLKGVQVVEYDQPALAEVTDKLAVLANVEGLPAHGQAALIRRQPHSEK